MRTYRDVRKQIEALQREAETLKKRERASVIARIRRDMSEYGITPEDLEGPMSDADLTALLDDPPAKTKRKLRQARRMFRHPETGREWIGTGWTPQWLADAVTEALPLEAFVVEDPARPAKEALTPEKVREILANVNPGRPGHRRNRGTTDGP